MYDLLLEIDSLLFCLANRTLRELSSSQWNYRDYYSDEIASSTKEREMAKKMGNKEVNKEISLTLSPVAAVARRSFIQWDGRSGLKNWNTNYPDIHVNEWKCHPTNKKKRYFISRLSFPTEFKFSSAVRPCGSVKINWWWCDAFSEVTLNWKDKERLLNPLSVSQWTVIIRREETFGKLLEKCRWIVIILWIFPLLRNDTTMGRSPCFSIMTIPPSPVHRLKIIQMELGEDF